MARTGFPALHLLRRNLGSCCSKAKRLYWALKSAQNPMDIRKQITGDTHELLVAGRVDGEGANQLELEILAAIRANAQSIYVNLSQATFLCSAGLRVFLQYWRQMKNNKRLLLVTRPSPEVDEVLETTGFKAQLVEKV